jgi:hypothetical protein
MAIINPRYKSYCITFQFSNLNLFNFESLPNTNSHQDNSYTTNCGELIFDSAMKSFFARVGIHRANFTEFILDLRNCFSHPHPFILDLLTNIDLLNLYYLFLAGNGVVSSLFACKGTFRNA